MDKARDTREFLIEYLNNEVHPNCEYYLYSNLIDIADKAIAELTAHKAKIDALKEWCNDELDKYSEYQTDIECGLFQAYNNVFQKLEGPTNA